MEKRDEGGWKEGEGEESPSLPQNLLHVTDAYGFRQ
jgi:hypothetical protein